MKMLYIILGLVVLAAVILLALWWQRVGEPTPAAEKAVKDEITAVPQAENPYLELRSMALNMPFDQFGIESESKTPIPYGVVMDWNVGRGVITFTAFSSGDASMYTSSGGGIIGGVGDDSVRDTARSLVKKSEKFVPKAIRSDSTETPSEGSVKFFILTNGGRFIAEENLQNFDNGSSELLELFVAANKLISELRALDEHNRK